MYKKRTYTTDTGTDALVVALKHLSAKRVIIPTYTCADIVRAVKLAQCSFTIVDCGYDLQIDIDSVLRVSAEHDTIIVPHMFGIRANVEAIRNRTGLKIIEDLSQCHGLVDLGKYADIVVSSTNKSKWLDLGGGGFVFTDDVLNLNSADFTQYEPTIVHNLNVRTQRVMELKESGIQLIGQESSWLRGMYFTAKTSTRTPYTPLHKLEQTVACPIVDSYIDKVNWISILV